jgi:hypothetical protein
VGTGPVPQQAAPVGEPRPELEGRQHPEQPGQAEGPEQSPWFNTQQQPNYHGGYDPGYEPEPPYVGDEEYWQFYEGQQQAEQYQNPAQAIPEQYRNQIPEQYPNPVPDQYQNPVPEQPREPSPEDTGSFPIPVSGNRMRELGEGGGTPEPDEESYYQVFKQSINGSYPTPREFIDNVEAEFRISLPSDDAKRMVSRFTNRHTAELEEDHIA